jgi:hypothetical protein
LHDTR